MSCGRAMLKGTDAFAGLANPRRTRQQVPPPPGLAHAQPDLLGFLWLDPAALPANFAHDVPVQQARSLSRRNSRPGQRT